MTRRFLLRAWETNPLAVLGIGLFAQILAVQLGWLEASLLLNMILVMELAYVQNNAYALQSRSANRNSNAYHLIAAVAANLAYFWSLRILVIHDLKPILLIPYVFATVMGTLHGNTASIRIEAALGLKAEGAKGTPQFLKLWPTVAVLLAVLAWQTISLEGHVVAVPKGPGVAEGVALGVGVLALMMFATILGNFTFAILRVARNSDSYWFHFVAVVVNVIADFVKYALIIKFRADWAMFLPLMTGSVIGSLLGANFGQELAKRMGAKFDIHVFKKEEMAEREKTGQIIWPKTQLILLALLLLPQTIFFGVKPWLGLKGGAVLLFFSTWQALSFTMKSRAGQRNNQQYLAWASVFSNGVWFLTMHQLALGTITPEKAMPYILGGAAGSLIGQLLSMKAERATGALMDAPTALPS